MRNVLGTIFCDELSFVIPTEKARQCTSVARTMEEAFRMACVIVGIELIDYDTVTFSTVPHTMCTRVVGHSRLWRERMTQG